MPTLVPMKFDVSSQDFRVNGNDWSRDSQLGEFRLRKVPFYMFLSIYYLTITIWLKSGKIARTHYILLQEIR